MHGGLCRAAIAPLVGLLAITAVARGLGQAPPTPHEPAPPGSVRLYVFDCGVIHVADPARFQLKKEELAATDFSVACYLVVHPKGTLVWDVGAVPDAAWTPTGSPVTVGLVLADSQHREVTVLKPLRTQLADAGYAPSDVTYLALSHYHYDHTANANDFAAATWLVRKEERDAMFAARPPPFAQPATYAALRRTPTVILSRDEHDVFGDGTVMIKSAPGHTPGHQVLFVKLAETGSVVVSGDLYHYPEERTLDRVPTFEFNAEQTRASRRVIEAFLKQTGAQLWIQHDLLANARLKKGPAYYQ